MNTQRAKTEKKTTVFEDSDLKTPHTRQQTYGTADGWAELLCLLTWIA